MKTIIFTLAMCAASFGCTDRGKCLAQHSERVWFQPAPIVIPQGNSQPPMVINQVGFWTDETVCDKWEFPNGKGD